MKLKKWISAVLSAAAVVTAMSCSITASAFEPDYANTPIDYIYAVRVTDYDFDNGQVTFSFDYNSNFISYRGIATGAWYYSLNTVQDTILSNGWHRLTIEADITDTNTTALNYDYGLVLNVKLKAIANTANVCNAFRLGSYSSYIANTSLTAQQDGYQLGSAYTAYELSALGDIQQDWIISNADRDCVTQYNTHQITLTGAEINRANVNFDSLIDVSDAVSIISYASGSSSGFFS